MIKKERIERSPLVSARRSMKNISPKLALAACLAAALAAGGCDTFGHLENGWFNPAEVGRFKKEPLLLPVVQTLDTGIEEPNDQFTQAQDVKPEDLVANEVDYVVGRNDLLTVSITDLVGPGVETVKSVRVSESGNISLPLVGQVHCEGLTEAQLETEIQRAYREANLMPNAQVSVSVTQALARTFSILGTIQRPGQYQITQADFRILDALVTAGDITSQGVDYLYVIRREDLGRRTSPSTMPAAAPAMPGGTAPAPRTTPGAPGDVLQPRSQAIGVNQPVLLAAAAPASTPATPAAPAGSEGRYITIDGKQVLVGNQGAATNARSTAAPSATPAAAPMTSPAANTGASAMAPTGAPTTRPFEFQNPMGGGNTRVIRVPLTMLKNGDLRYNIVVHAQDMIIAPLPTTGEYYIDGHVNRTGVYSLTARKISLKQAIAAAGGFDGLATPTRTDIIRRIGDDKEIFASVDLDKVFSGQQPDIYLKPNDVVRVGTNAFQPFVASFRNAFRITYGFGFLYDRNYAPQQKQQQ